MKFPPWRTLGKRALIVTVLTSGIGIPLFVGSIHSGGVNFWAAAVLVPPLFLDIAGYLRIDEFWLWLFTVLMLQAILVSVLVYGFSWVQQSMESEPISNSK